MHSSRGFPWRSPGRQYRCPECLASELERPRWQFAIREPDNCLLASNAITTKQHAACSCCTGGALLGFGAGTSIHVTKWQSSDEISSRSEDENPTDCGRRRTSAWCRYRFV